MISLCGEGDLVWSYGAGRETVMANFETVRTTWNCHGKSTNCEGNSSNCHCKPQNCEDNAKLSQLID